MDAPVPVRRAILLLWVSLLLTLVETIVSLARMLDEGPGFVAAMSAMFGLMFGFNALLIYFAGRRRNWARLWLAVWIVAGAGLIAAFWRDMDMDTWWSWIPTVAEYLLEIAALVLLFTGAGANWYRSRAA